ncbi:MAG TPA: 50S ribosomal protein L9 [Saprospiraceae bacterium]|nr:50S ribosomal protein L9 [Saprospiraceae bacterium]
MEIILLQDVDNVGSKHDVVSVKDGHGRNYLIPQKLAIVANKGNRARLEDMKKQEASREAKMLGHYEQIAASLKDVVLKIGAKAGTTGKIFGSVTNAQLAQALKEQFNVEIERRKIVLPDEVKTIGSYTAVLHLHPQVETQLQFEVVQE